MKEQWKKSNRPLSKREANLKANILKSVKRLPEPKNHYSSQALNNVGFGGNIFNLFDPAQGDTSQTREGDRCTCTHVSIRGRVASNLTAGNYNNVRVIVFYWRHDTGERIPVVSDVLQATYASASWTPLGPVVVGEEAKTIQIISDRTYDVSTESNTAQSFHVNMKLNKKVYFNDGATTGRNQLHLLAISDDGVSAYPQFQFISNVQFRDI